MKLFMSAVAFAVLTGVAAASAPMVKTQAPGFYRVMLGDFEITALSDGAFPLDAEKLLTNTTPAKVNKALARAFLKSPVETSVNAYLINTGQKLVLIDAGSGKLFGPTVGRLLISLTEAGYKPEQVDEIYITHLHGDHVGGIAPDGKIVFPNAIVRADKHDADFWLSEETLKKAPAEMKAFVEGAQSSVKPYIKAGKFKTFDGDTDLVAGVTAVATRGHTPGHSVYVAESRGQKMVFWGDLMHVAAVQFANPGVTIQFDIDSKAAAAQRKKAYVEAARQGYLVASAHISFPGIGRLRAEGKGYTWLPVNYSPLR